MRLGEKINNAIRNRDTYLNLQSHRIGDEDAIELAAALVNY